MTSIGAEDVVKQTSYQGLLAQNQEFAPCWAGVMGREKQHCASWNKGIVDRPSASKPDAASSKVILQ